QPIPRSTLFPYTTLFRSLDGTGWGSPFLLVPEATNVDEDTLRKLANAQPGDFYLSDASPLGVPFHNFRPSSSEEQRKLRIARNRSEEHTSELQSRENLVC